MSAEPFGPDEGLFETMRAEDGRVPLLEDHLARLAGSAAALGLTGMATPERVRAEVLAAVATAPREVPLRVRATATRAGALAVAVAPLDADPAPTAVTLPGWWDPAAAIREHKTTRYEHFRRAAAMAREHGAGHAVLCDDAGRPGEAATASLVVVSRERALTPPVRGLLAGVARGILVAAGLVREAPLGPRALLDAEEVIAVNALRGAMPLLEIDGRPVGAGRPGPWAARLSEALRAAGAGGGARPLRRARGARRRWPRAFRAAASP